MKVTVKGQGEVSLTQNNYVATGGQASVYIKQGIAYKIYTDPKDMIPEAKFHDLAKIPDDKVIKPQKILLDAKNNRIGYTMNAVDGDPASLCQLFTRAFRERNNISNDQIIGLVSKLQEHVDNVHKTDIVIVDLNELNLLVPKTFDDAYFIDVDSYQTKGFPATVIMPSVRDWHCRPQNFSALTDWFSLSVLAFQLFIGIHPYKGGHVASGHVEKDKRLLHRMQNNISAFRPDVSLPKCCYPLDVIPQAYRDWLKAVLEDGKRCHPPDPKGGPAVVIQTVLKPVIVSDALDIKEAMDLEGWTLLSYAECQMASIALAVNGPDMRGYHTGRLVYSQPTPKGVTLAGLTPKNNTPIALNLHNGNLSLIDFNTKKTTDLGIRANEIAKSDDRYYIRNGSKVLELDFMEVGNQITVLASTVVANVMDLASHLYEGCAIQNMVGSVFVSLFPTSKAGYQVRMPELDGYRIMDAKFDGGVLMVVGSKAGSYDRLIFRFDSEYSVYDIRKVEDITPTGLNFITLPKVPHGVCVCVTEDEEVEAFSAKKDAQGLKIVKDKAIGNDMRLLKIHGRAGFARGTKLFHMSLK